MILKRQISDFLMNLLWYQYENLWNDVHRGHW